MKKQELALILTGFLQGACLDPLVEQGLIAWVNKRSRKICKMSTDDLGAIFWGAIESLEEDSDEDDPEFQLELEKVFGPRTAVALEDEDDGLEPEQKEIVHSLISTMWDKVKKKKKKRKK